MPIPVTALPLSYNSSATGGFQPGDEYPGGDGNVYRFVRLTDAVAAGIGMVAEWANLTSYQVTVDRAGGSSLGRIPAGVFVCTVTPGSAGPPVVPGNYCFILIRGRVPLLKDAANGLAAAVRIVPHATVDGDAAPIAGAYATTLNPCGVCLAANGGGTCTAEIHVR